MSGVGTELKKLTTVFGNKACPSCQEKAKILDDNGPGWAVDNFDTVVRWVVWNSKRMFVSRLIPEAIRQEAARGLVLEAIKLAQESKLKSENITGGENDKTSSADIPTATDGV